MAWRLQAGAAPPQREDRAAQITAILDRIENAIDGDVAPRLVWPPTEAGEAALRRPIAAEGAARQELFDYWWSDAWIQEHPPAAALRDHLISILSTGMFFHLSEAAAYDFAVALVNNVSWRWMEYEKMIGGVRALSQYQIDELVKILSEERQSYLKLLETESAEIVSYIHRRVRNALIPLPAGTTRPSTAQLALRLGNDGPAVWIDGLGRADEPWRVASNLVVLSAEGLRLIPETPPSIDDQPLYDGQQIFPNERHFVRLVRPLFTAEDLDGLIPIPEDEPAAQDG